MVSSFMDSEILVHVAAPSAAADDARYRAQVQAILGFEGVSRQVITLGEDGEDDEDEDASLSLPSTAAFTQDPHVTPYIPAIPSPRSVPPALPPTIPSQPSLDSLVSVIPDSQPEKQPPANEHDQHTSDPPNPTPQHPSPSSFSPPTKRCRLNLVPTPDQVLHPTSSPKPTNTNTNTSTQTNIPLPLTINPPQPPISTSPFTTHITPTLSMLHKRLLSPRTYTPLHETRPLEALERGHWFIPITLCEKDENQTLNRDQNLSSIWTGSFFARFWAFLSGFVAEGRAGWGVWCVLEGEDGDGHEDGDKGDEGQRVSLKVYAWGEVAVHVYLVLFLASERRVRRMGAQWRDSKGEVVVQMP